MAVQLKPLHDRVIIERLDDETVSAGGIMIPDSAKEKPMRGKVVGTGPGKMLDNGQLLPLGVKAGDEVLFGKYSGTEVKLEGTEYVVMREDDIMGIVG